MLILKHQTFSSARSLTLFVNNNNIPRENIVIITNGNTTADTQDYTIFFYGDTDVKEKVPGFFD